MFLAFGSGHFAQDGTNLGDRYVDLGEPRDDERYSRLRAILLFGVRWSAMYATLEQMGVDEFALREYVVPARGWLAHSNHMGTPCSACARLDARGIRIG
jgi:hypothetical protein